MHWEYRCRWTWGLWTSSCNAETVNIWSLEESSLVSKAEVFYRGMKRTKNIHAANVNHPTCCQNKDNYMEVKWWRKGDEWKKKERKYKYLYKYLWFKDAMPHQCHCFSAAILLFCLPDKEQCFFIYMHSIFLPNYS